MQIKFTRKFSKQYDKAGKKIKVAFNNRLKLFSKDQFHPQLNNHRLTGKLKGHRSINITGDWRAIFSETRDVEGNQVSIFEIIGTHSQLYK